MTDESVMEAVKNGHLERASVLFERYHRRIFNFLLRLTRNRDEAEDLTQNVFFRMIRYRSTFRDDSRFVPWIYQIARNVFSDHYQMNRNKLNLYLDVEKIQDELEDTNASDMQTEKEALLLRSMDLLSEEQRELLILTRFQHMKYEEVAQIMDTTVANIKVKVHRAISKLREHYFQLDKA